MILSVCHFYRLKNSASSLSLSGWRHIFRTGSSSVETCTAPAVPRGGSLIAGSGFTVLFFSLRARASSWVPEVRLLQMLGSWFF